MLWASASQQSDFGVGHGDGQISSDRQVAVASVAIESGRDVQGDDRQPRGVDLGNQAGVNAGWLTPQAGSEQAIDDDSSGR